jgi:hypothetical protein
LSAVRWLGYLTLGQSDVDTCRAARPRG